MVFLRSFSHRFKLGSDRPSPRRPVWQETLGTFHPTKQSTFYFLFPGEQLEETPVCSSGPWYSSLGFFQQNFVESCLISAAFQWTFQQDSNACLSSLEIQQMWEWRASAPPNQREVVEIMLLMAMLHLLRNFKEKLSVKQLPQPPRLHLDFPDLFTPPTMLGASSSRVNCHCKTFSTTQQELITVSKEWWTPAAAENLRLGYETFRQKATRDITRTLQRSHTAVSNTVTHAGFP